MQPQRKVWLTVLKQSTAQLRKAIFKYGPIDPVLVICELSMNHIQGNLKLAPSLQTSKLQKSYITTLSQRKISIVRKRRFLVNPVGLKVVSLLLEDHLQHGTQNDISGRRLPRNAKKVRDKRI